MVFFNLISRSSDTICLFLVTKTEVRIEYSRKLRVNYLPTYKNKIKFRNFFFGF